MSGCFETGVTFVSKRVKSMSDKTRREKYEQAAVECLDALTELTKNWPPMKTAAGKHSIDVWGHVRPACCDDFKAGAEWLAKWLIAARQQHISEGGSFFSEFDVEDLIEQATGIKEKA